ncbi:MAG: methyltransferase [Planctomycetota bacterium]|nr:MAG: methyltransferase [Planctomycetota bacterium]
MGNVGEKLKAENANWNFGGETCQDFDEHVIKSVPLYEEGHELICQLSDYFVKNDSVVYDIGCSTASLLNKLADHNKNKKDVCWRGIDQQQEMVEFATLAVKANSNIEISQSNINECVLESSDMIISYYTMQFIHPSVRQDIINMIYESLNWGGAFVIFEKVRGNDARFQDLLTGLYTEYKLKNGYGAEEILNKQRSLKGILEPFSTEGNIDLFKRAGFQDIISISKFICFEGFLCIK